jgi:protein-L-isoaspartate(D-aspartate) O-methyltransferase
LALGGAVEVRIGDGSIGDAEHAPWDGIIVTAAAPSIPASLREQLSPDGGRLVIPVGDRRRQDLLLIRRRGNEWLETNDGPCVFVPLVGAEGFSG